MNIAVFIKSHITRIIIPVALNALCICAVILFYPGTDSPVVLILFVVPILYGGYHGGFSAAMINGIIASLFIIIYLSIVKPESVWRSALLSVIVFIGVGGQIGALFNTRRALKTKAAELETATKELRDNQTWFQALWDSSPAGIFITDPHSQTIVDANTAALDLLERQRDEVIGIPCRSLVCQAPEGSCPVLDSKGEFKDREQTILNAEGREIPILKRVRQVALAGRVRLLEAFVDISTIKETEAKLKDSEERYSSLFARVPAGLYRTTADGEILDANPALATLLGFDSADELIGKNAANFYVHQSDRDLLKQKLQQDGSVENLEVLLRRPDRKEIAVFISAQFTGNRSSGGNAVIEGAINDVTKQKELAEERNALERQRQRAERMLAVGELAAGVAHDLNNVLAGIRMNAESLLYGKQDADKNEMIAKRISNAVDRSSGVVEGLLSSIGTHLFSPERISLTELTRDYYAKCRLFDGAKAKRSIFLANDPVWVNADANLIGRCLDELMKNSVEAIKDGGSATVSCGKEPLDTRNMYTAYDQAAGLYGCVSVADDGPGMSRDIKNRVFEPYFTTQEFGKSAGIGLTKVFGIVTQHNGHIAVISEPGEGTTLKIYLPLA